MAALYGLDPVRVENHEAGPGTPDINFIEGWIESKVIPAWPKRINTPVRVPHFRREQRSWLAKRGTFGGNAYVVLEITEDGTVLVFPALFAAEHVGNLDTRTLCARASLVMHPWSTKQFRDYIDRRNPRRRT